MIFTSKFLRQTAINRRLLSPLRTRHPNRAVASHGQTLGEPEFSKRWMSSSNSGNGKDGDDKDDLSLIVSQFKNQIVHQLWTERAKAKKETSSKPLGGASTCPSLEKAGKTPCQSETKVEYPFSTQELLAESYKSPWNTMRIGKILEDLDALAGNIAFYHVRQESQKEGVEVVHPLIVTASVDRIKLKKESPTMPQDQVLSGRVTFVGTSSMEIRMHCTAAGEDEPWLESFVTFVTLDPETKKPMHITPLLPQNAQEQADFDLGAKKAAQKKERRKQQKLTATNVQQQAEALLKEARPVLLHMPSQAAQNSLLMNSTKMQNAMIAQPQVRNLHHRIFGGYLMRKAFELAFANAYVFGGARPVFREVDEISFAAPVDVGDLLVFNSRVVYTSSNHQEEDGEPYPLVHLEVETWVTVPEQADAKLSNQFYFTFAITGDSDGISQQSKTPTELRKIVPANIDEATRMAIRMEADRAQAAY